MFARKIVIFCLLVLLGGGAIAQRPNGEEAQEGGEKEAALSSRYYADLAQVHAKYKVYDQAEECLKNAIELEENNTVSSGHAFQLAQLYLQWGRDDDAEMMYEFSLELTPDASSLVNRSRELARFYEGKKQYDKAEAVYTQALKKAEGPVARTLRKEFYRMCLKSGRLDEIIARKEKEAADNKDAIVLADLGYLYRLSGDKKKEMETYQKLSEADPRDQKALFQLANAYRAAGETDKAAEAFEKLIKINPPARPYYISEIVKLYTRAGRTEEAEKWSNELVSDEERETSAGRARLARLYNELNVYDKAIEHYLAAVKLAEDPRQKEQYELQLARVYLNARKLAEAEEICKRLVDSTKNNAVRREIQAMLARIKRMQDQ